MKGAERSEKFNEFKRLHQAGQLQARDIVDHLGISKNTLYNWRKRLRNEIAGAKPVHNQPDSAFPLFTKIIPQQKPAPSIGRYIEIAIGSFMVCYPIMFYGMLTNSYNHYSKMMVKVRNEGGQ